MYNKFSFLPLILFGVMIFLYLLPDDLKEESLTEHNKAGHPEGLSEFEWGRIVNPVTGKIPGGAVYRAYQQLVKTGKISTNERSEKTFSNYPHWSSVNDFFQTLSITKLTYNPNNTDEFYFCTGEGWFNADAVLGAGIWKSQDGGDNWSQLSSTDTSIFFHCQDMVVHPSGDIYVATRNGGLQRSQDQGGSWMQVLGKGNGSVSNRIGDIELTANGNLFVTIGIFDTDGIYYSDNGDTGTWVKQTNGFPASGIYRIEIAAAPSNDNIAYAIAISNLSQYYHIKGFYKTVDKGITWIKGSIPGGDSSKFSKKQGWYDLILAVDPNNEDVIAAGGLHLWRSKDGGTTWQKITHGKDDSTGYVHVDQHEIVFLNSDTVLFGNDGGIWKCNNFSEDTPIIYNRNATYNCTQFYSVAVHPDQAVNSVIGGTQDNGSQISISSGVSDFNKLTGADGSFCAINYNNGNIIYTTKQYLRMYRFNNGGSGDYQAITNAYLKDGSSSNGGNTLFINPFEMDPNNPEILYLASNRGLWRLKNASIANDSSWEKASANWGIISAIGISTSPPNIVFIGRQNVNSTIFSITDAHISDDATKPINSDPADMLPQTMGTNSYYTSCIYVNPTDANHVLVVYSNYGIESIFESKNALDEIPVWVSVEGDLPDIPVRWALLHPTNPSVCYIATEAGVFYTNALDSSNTVWLPSNNGLAFVRTDMLRYRKSDNSVVAATHGRGLFLGKIQSNNEIFWEERGPSNIGGRTRTIMADPNDPRGLEIWAGSVSGGLWNTKNIDFIDEDEEPGVLLPDSLHFTVYPNPSPVSTITFTINLHEKSSFTINIYNISGKCIKSIHESEISPGYYNLNWAPEPHIAKGMYLIELYITGQRLIKKLAIL